MTIDSRKGIIVTFYSYKGGTGRTMALANVATWLSQYEQKKVLMIDWDLEAPGLHTYFGGYFGGELNNGPGLIDFFELLNHTPNESIIKTIEEEFDDYLIPINISGSEDLYMLKAGRLDANYNEKIQTFNWRTFFADKYEVFPYWIEFLQRNFDYVLVDSRTGLTDISGICTMVLPERVVTVFTPNNQSLDNLLNTLDSWVEYRLASADLRPYMIYPLPSRVETNELDLYKEWRSKYIDQFEQKFRHIYKIDWCRLKPYLDLVALSYIPKYAYGEKISVIIDGIKEAGNSKLNVKQYVELIKAITSNENLWDYSYLVSENYKEAIERIRKENEEKTSRIDLSSLELIEIPPAVSELSNLESLDISKNEIDEIGGLKNLLSLRVLLSANNQITEIDTLGNLISLQELDLSNNRITDIVSIGKLTSLQQLNLSSNDINDIGVLKGLRNLRELNLSGNQLVDVSALQNLANLDKLNVSNSQISDVSVLQHLTGLTEAYLSSNQIKNVSFLEHLIRLTTLDLSNNGLTNISALQGLTGLRTLDLSANQIADINSLQGLTKLTMLYLHKNQVKDISVLQGLTSLKTLDLSGNQIADITPIKHLLETGVRVKWENDNSGGIILGDNPLTTPPPEIIKQGNEAVLNYFRELEEQSLEYLYEAKLLIIGDGSAGKTTLVRKLKDENASMPAENETARGIDIEPYTFKTANDKIFKINIWDFAGQEIYHATHQFFLTKSSLYILVDDTSKDDKTVNDASFSYWLQVVSLYSGNSPLLIVQNEKGDRTKELDMRGMMGRFEFIKGKFRTNLLTGRGLAQVREAIHYQIQNLPHVGEKLPKTWLSIRKELESLAKTKNTLSLVEYLFICSKNNITNDEQALHLSTYLHDLGLFLHFQDDLILKNILILNTEWVTEAVYKILYNKKIKEAFGRFNNGDLSEIWADATYRNHHKELLALMIKFEVCYKLKDVSAAWLMPQLLTVQAPEIQWDSNNNLIVRYTYDFMPKGLLSRLIVSMHKYIKDEKLAWRSGVVLEKQASQALITETYGSREIVIKVKGAQRRELMYIITEDLDKFHLLFENLKVEKLIPCNCSQCRNRNEPNFYVYMDLMMRKERGKRTIECDISFEDVEITTLLEGVSTEIKELKKSPNGTLKIFLSYSHKDEKLKNELDAHLLALKRSNKISVWNDRRIQVGDKWDETVNEELKRADIILLLISPDFLASEYIWDIEVKSAMERQEHGEAKIIPIFLRACLFDETPFAKLQGLPKNAKPVTSFADRDEAFLQVVQGLRGVIDNWKK